MQELIMTGSYSPTPLSPTGRFPSAAFCVFSNRLLAVLLGSSLVRVRHGALFPPGSPPLAAFAPPALSNTCSSWAQYLSLRFVPFPVQTMFKSSKVLPVMAVGRLLKGARYTRRQLLEAAGITLGVLVFSASSPGKSDKGDTSVPGVALLVLYVLADAFTSQWQARVYERFGRDNCDQYQMIMGVYMCFCRRGGFPSHPPPPL
jgi:adenosine 3'-phospho 5'-phosphosulfate transporter B2